MGDEMHEDEDVEEGSFGFSAPEEGENSSATRGFASEEGHTSMHHRLLFHEIYIGLSWPSSVIPFSAPKEEHSMLSIRIHCIGCLSLDRFRPDSIIPEHQFRSSSVSSSVRRTPELLVGCKARAQREEPQLA